MIGKHYKIYERDTTNLLHECYSAEPEKALKAFEESLNEAVKGITLELKYINQIAKLEKAMGEDITELAHILLSTLNIEPINKVEEYISTLENKLEFMKKRISIDKVVVEA